MMLLLLVLRSLLLVSRVGRLVGHPSPGSLLGSLSETGASRHLSSEKILTHVEVLSSGDVDVVGGEHS